MNRLRDTAVLGTVLVAGLSSQAWACLPGSLLYLPFVGTFVLLAAVTFISGSFKKDPAESRKARLSSVFFTAPLALAASVAALSGSSRGDGWECTFSSNIVGQVVFHILVPLAVVLVGAWVQRNRYPGVSFLEVAAWSVIGLWAASILNLSSIVGYSSRGGSVGFPWQVLHYATIGTYCFVPLSMPQLSSRVATFERVVGLFLVLGVVGYGFGYSLKALG